MSFDFKAEFTRLLRENASLKDQVIEYSNLIENQDHVIQNYEDLVGESIPITEELNARVQKLEKEVSESKSTQENLTQTLKETEGLWLKRYENLLLELKCKQEEWDERTDDIRQEIKLQVENQIKQDEWHKYQGLRSAVKILGRKLEERIHSLVDLQASIKSYYAELEAAGLSPENVQKGRMFNESLKIDAEHLKALLKITSADSAVPPPFRLSAEQNCVEMKAPELDQ